jgi:hypothetical protein
MSISESNFTPRVPEAQIISFNQSHLTIPPSFSCFSILFSSFLFNLFFSSISWSLSQNDFDGKGNFLFEIDF